MTETRNALIVGAGAGLSASLARKARAEGLMPLLAARNTDKLSALVDDVDGAAHACDVTDLDQVKALFDWATSTYGVPELVIFNASSRVRGPIAEIDPIAVKDAITITAYGGFLVGQAAAQEMLSRGSGSIFFTGASASVKGYVNSATFAMGKFGLRGMAQSMSRELAPQGIHVGHFIIDGGISKSASVATGELDPDAIADSYFHLHNQPKSAWTWEMELRPFVEKF